MSEGVGAPPLPGDFAAAGPGELGHVPSWWCCCGGGDAAGKTTPSGFAWAGELAGWRREGGPRKEFP